MPRFPAFLRSMLHLAARESGRYRLDGVRVVSAGGVTSYTATDGRRIARATIKTPDAPPCDVILPAEDMARLLGRPLGVGCDEDEFGNEYPRDDDTLRGGVEFTVPEAPGGKSTVSAVVDTKAGIKGAEPWPDDTGPGIFPRGEPVASILVNAEFVREMLLAAEDASTPLGCPASVWLSIFTVTLPADATHKKARVENRLTVQTHNAREDGLAFGSVLMPIDASGTPRPALPAPVAPGSK